MTDQERKEMVATLHLTAKAHHTMAQLYEIAADTVAGFTTEEEYQALAAEAFASAQSSIDAWPEVAR